MNFREVAIKAAVNSSKLLSLNFGKLKSVSTKANDFDLVTNVDVESENAIVNEIKKQFPEHTIMAEESTPTVNDNEYLWLVDPLDGTLNYSRQLPFYANSIALAKNGKVILGVVALPFSNELFVAEIGKGCYLNDKKIQVSNRPLSKGVVSLCPEPHFVNFEKICKHGTTAMASAVTGFAFVASGRMEARTMCSAGKPWDFAAGSLLVEEAGGCVTDWNGKPWNLKSKTILASNRICHEEVLKLIQAVV